MHQTASCGGEGSVGDLARITRRLHDLDFDVQAVGGGESFLRDGSVGILSFLVEPDDPADLERLREELVQMDLGGGRKPLQVEIHPGFDLEMSSGPGSLAAPRRVSARTSARTIRRSISLSALLVDVHGDWAIVAFAFEDDETRDRAAGDSKAKTASESCPSTAAGAVATKSASTSRTRSRRATTTTAAGGRRLTFGRPRVRRWARFPGADPHGDRRRLDSVVDTELVEDVGDVDARGLRADEQHFGDLGIRSPGGNQLEDLPLAGR